jgi:hypothetical protein
MNVADSFETVRVDAFGIKLWPRNNIAIRVFTDIYQEQDLIIVLMSDT